jgi:hypothetical protein
VFKTFFNIALQKRIEDDKITQTDNSDLKSRRDKIRELIGYESERWISGEELDVCAKKQSLDYYAAEEACNFIAIKAEEQGNDKIAKRFKQRAKELHDEAAMRAPPSYVKGNKQLTRRKIP